MEKLKEILNFLIEQGKEIPWSVLEETLEKVYNLGRQDAYSEQTDKELDNICVNFFHEINRRRNKLLEENFYREPSTEAVIEMKAYDLIKEILPEVIKHYRENTPQSSAFAKSEPVI